MRPRPCARCERETRGGAVSRGREAASSAENLGGWKRARRRETDAAHLEARNARTEVREESRGARRGTVALCARVTTAFMAVTACMVHSTVARRLPSFFAPCVTRYFETCSYRRSFGLAFLTLNRRRSRVKSTSHDSKSRFAIMLRKCRLETHTKKSCGLSIVRSSSWKLSRFGSPRFRRA